MTIIDTYPNVERAITYNEASSIFKKEYEILKSISYYIKEKIRKENECNINDYGVIKYYLEQAIRNAECPHIKENNKKEIIIGNVLLSDDLKIAELLTKNGITIEHLKVIIRFRALLKKVILNSVPIDEELERQFKLYKIGVAKIIKIFKLELNFDDQTVILNRITELLITSPNYFESKNSEHTKKK